ncbi:MAG: hypothetical protein WAM53_19635 [Terrimicrobiaceae bacterium]
MRRITTSICALYLSAAVVFAAEKEATKPYKETLSLLGVTFRVKSAGMDGQQELIIIPNGLEIDNSTIKKPIKGLVTKAEVADLNADGSPEIYVYITLSGKDNRGEVVALSANKKKSLSEIHIPELTAGDPKLHGYRGHDEFAVVENVLVRRFPIYKDGDSDAKPTGGTRQFQYKLTPGEAGWILRLDKTVDY